MVIPKKNQLVGLDIGSHSVKLVEIEELFEKNERVTELDMLELKKDVEALEKKLNAVGWVASKRKSFLTSKSKPGKPRRKHR